MRFANLLGLVLLGLSVVILAPDVTNGQGKKNKGGGGPGGFGGFGGMNQDPNTMFDMLAKGRQFFLITETRMLGGPLTQFSQERGIKNGQITRQQFLDFQDWRAKQQAAGGGPGVQPFGGGGAFGGGGQGFGGFGKKNGGEGKGGPTISDVDALNARADEEFRKRDDNKDGYLTMQEASDRLKKDFALWDTDGDGKISLTEYRAYFAAIRQGAGGGARDTAAIVIQEEDLDAKPVVFRVGVGGKMPAGLPPWFLELDTDKDGQVALYEWRRAGKAFDEFAVWDLNGDGFITPDEALRQQTVIAKTFKGSMGAMGFGGSGEEGDPGQRKFGKGGPGGGKGFGKGGDGNPWAGFGKGGEGNPWAAGANGERPSMGFPQFGGQGGSDMGGGKGKKKKNNGGGN